VVKTPLADQFWGDRYGQVKDPFGFRWAIATRKEELTPEEMQKHAAKLFGGGAPAASV
jgi:PhnB protein